MPPGQTYGAFRRELCREPEPALLCEYCRGGLSDPLALAYRAGGRAPTHASLGGAPVVSRFFAYLQPKEMEDLDFIPRGASRTRDYEVLIERTGTATLRERASGGRATGLGDAITRFTDDCGALPQSPADLLRPTDVGWDASGNSVKIDNWRGPYVKVTKGSSFDESAWVFDPLNIVFCDRARMSGTVKPATARDCRNAGW